MANKIWIFLRESNVEVDNQIKWPSVEIHFATDKQLRYKINPGVYYYYLVNSSSTQQISFWSDIIIAPLFLLFCSNQAITLCLCLYMCTAQRALYIFFFHP